MRLSALLLRRSRFPVLLLFLALVGLLIRLLLLGLALFPAAQLPERALDAASGLVGCVAHRLGGALDAASGLVGCVAHRLGGALDRLGGALDRLGGALDGGPADLAERLRASGQPVGYGGHPAEHGLRSGLLCGLHQRAANL